MASKASTPPYPSAARISDSPCFPQYTASLKCELLTFRHLFLLPLLIYVLPCIYVHYGLLFPFDLSHVVYSFITEKLSFALNLS
ncbi:hypothetical protein CJ030_MR1G017993 [Morella rubra]|uniref:Uncharacterized protein n=1 Tax=Morella rubra TaxID=262757 RepID=A0A6A1WKV7_9ROSI|nr:hypothetical protein CJ030_MR1G017993 [Morella rubra]